MLWLIGGLGLYTLLSFRAAMIASEIMVIVHGTPAHAALEDRCKLSWYRPESFLGYHPLHHRLWFAMASFPAMPSEALAKQRELRVIFGIQTVTLIVGMAAIIALGLLS